MLRVMCRGPIAKGQELRAVGYMLRPEVEGIRAES